ncbi:carboxypeptidase regulatory-like domain-containing protein [Viscerimonas tarda]
MKQKLMLFLMFLFSISAYSQYAEEVRGYIVDAETQTPLQGVAVVLQDQHLSSITGSSGEFVFARVRIGDDRLVVNAQSVKEAVFPVTIRAGKVINLGNFEVETLKQESKSVDDQAYVTNLEELDLDSDSDVSSQSISSLVLLSHDPYADQTSYQFSQVRFRARGYANKYGQTYLSGVEFNDQIRGQFNYSMIGAMNDMTRNGDALNYTQPGSFTFGDIGGSQNINMRAGNYAKGGKISLSYTNSNYYARAMASYSTGLRDNGWAFSALVGGRYSDEGYVDGTFYNNASYFLAAEKQWDGGKHSLSFTTFGSPVQRGQAGASVMEAYNLTGDYFYNPNWGYQDGKKRNARIVTAYDPTAILSHVYKPNKDTRLTTGLGVHYNRYGGTALNWFGNAADPRPDYYRNLPSYEAVGSMKFLKDLSTYDLLKYTSSNPTLSDYEKANMKKYVASYLRWKGKDQTKTQINWYDLYRANLGKDSASYIVEERRNDLLEITLNSTLDKRLNDNILLTAGLGLRSTKAMTFSTVNDLLGAKYIIDTDKYGERDFPGDKSTLQNDLNNPNRKVYEGDRFGYDYNIQVQSANAWFQNQHTYANIDFYYGLKLAYTSFYRDGNMKNGRHRDDSYGKGEVHGFFDPTIKAGFTYKADGRNFIVGNISYGTQAPLPYDAYIAPRVWDKAIPILESEKILSADLGYVFSFPSLTGRLSVFQTNFYDQTDKASYYHDMMRTYVHHVMSNMNKVHHGVELGLSYKTPLDGLTLSFGGTVSEYYYANNPDGQVFYENAKKVDVDPEPVYMKGFYVGSTPQIAATFGIDYFYKYWFWGVNLNGFARSYLDPEPSRRVFSALGFSEYDPDAYVKRVKEYVSQLPLKGGMTLDVSIGKILYLANGHSMSINFSLNNVLNYTHLQTGGYEQGRIDTQDYSLAKFPPKYYYMQGFNCYLNANYKF